MTRADEPLDSDEELVEVDLTKFDLANDMMDWSPPEAAQLPQSYTNFHSSHTILTSQRNLT